MFCYFFLYEQQQPIETEWQSRKTTTFKIITAKLHFLFHHLYSKRELVEQNVQNNNHGVFEEKNPHFDQLIFIS